MGWRSALTPKQLHMNEDFYLYAERQPEPASQQYTTPFAVADSSLSSFASSSNSLPFSSSAYPSTIGDPTLYEEPTYYAHYPPAAAFAPLPQLSAHPALWPHRHQHSSPAIDPSSSVLHYPTPWQPNYQPALSRDLQLGSFAETEELRTRDLPQTWLPGCYGASSGIQAQSEYPL